MMKFLVGLAASFPMLAGCGEDDLSRVSLAFSSHESTPVVVTEFSLNGSNLGLLPLVVDGRAGQRPNQGAARMDMKLGRGSGSTLKLRAGWVELMTGHAWQGTVDVPVDMLYGIDNDRAEIMPVFGPNGLLLVTSDTLATDTEPARAVDIVQVCATRRPAADTDFKATPGALPQLREVLQDLDRPAPTDMVCADP